jgi:hypothetical protein
MSDWPQLELDQKLLANIHIEAYRHLMEPVEFLQKVVNEWSDAKYSGTSIPLAEGYSGVEESFDYVEGEDYTNRDFDHDEALDKDLYGPQDH